MVKGWQTFCDHFANCAEHFVVIGGTAAELAMTEAGIDTFRGTDDVDLVLVVECDTAEFLPHFFAFINAGGYECDHRPAGGHRLYRFLNPEHRDEYPIMIELLSRKQEGIELPADVRYTKIPYNGKSLSAILLDDAYYQVVLMYKNTPNAQVPVQWIGHKALIPLKAAAWRNLTRDQQRDAKSAKQSDIDKHADDVVKLSGLLVEDEVIEIPATVYADLLDFLDRGTSDMARAAKVEPTAIAIAVERIRAAYRAAV